MYVYIYIISEKLVCHGISDTKRGSVVLGGLYIYTHVYVYTYAYIYITIYIICIYISETWPTPLKQQ